MKHQQPLTPKIGDRVLVRYKGEWLEGHLKSKPYDFQPYWEVWVSGGRITRIYKPEDLSFIHWSEWRTGTDSDY